MKKLISLFLVIALSLSSLPWAFAQSIAEINNRVNSGSTKTEKVSKTSLQITANEASTRALTQPEKATKVVKNGNTSPNLKQRVDKKVVDRTSRCEEAKERNCDKGQLKIKEAPQKLSSNASESPSRYSERPLEKVGAGSKGKVTSKLEPATKADSKDKEE